ncbi:MAG: hypothetical protein R3C01_01160 [Planctomycetaceae bacterium]
MLPRRLWTGAVVALLCGLLPLAPSVRADDDAEAPAPAPVLIFTIAGVDRVMGDAEGVLDSIERGDMKAPLGGLLERVGNLAGIDRTKPFGVVLLLDTEQLPPRPKPIGFVPVSSAADLAKTVGLTGSTMEAVAGEADSYLLTPPNGDPMAVRIQNGYAYLTDNRLGLEGPLPDLGTLVDPLAARYDAALSIRFNAVPIGIRQVFVNFLRVSAETELQRRDEEPEAAYLVRRSNGINALELIEQLLTQGEDITIGWDATPEKKTATLEVSINATPDSEFAKYLHDSAGRPSMFTPLQSDDKPLSMSLSWLMNKREKTATTGLFQAAKSQLAIELPAAALPAGPLDRFFDAVQATIDSGQFDMFVQFAAPEPDKFVFLGGVKVVGGETLGLALGETLNHVIQRVASEGNTETAPQIIPQADEYEGVVIHKIIPRSIPAQERRVYGGTPEVFVGTSSRIVWFAVGKDEALPALKGAIDIMRQAPTQPVPAGGNVPFQLTARIAKWIQLPEPEFPMAEGTEENPGRSRSNERRAARAKERREVAQEAFSETDTLRIEARPTDSGLRIRVRFDEGFLRMMGLQAVRGFERSQL